MKRPAEERKMTPRSSRSDERGFSLVELLVAMLVTMIISGAIYGLLAQGNNAFRREPELVDRQQNIRIAMDLVQRDIAAAGMGMNAGVQVFSDGLDSAGPAQFPSVITAGGNSDILEMVTYDGACPPVSSCKDAGKNIFLQEQLPPCYTMPSLVFVADTDLSDPQRGVHFAEQPGGAGGGSPCGAYGDHVNFPPGQAKDWNPNQNFCNEELPPPAPPRCNRIYKISLVRYQIAQDPADRTPALWRSDFGTYDPTNGSDPGTQPPNGRWQLIARGIEDMQIQYQDGTTFPNNWLNEPPAANEADSNSIVRRVRVTLSARALAPNLQGESASVQGNAIRGRLIGITAPRAALINLQNAVGSPPPWQ
jgi:prepilin-type N-terminal cleavage/methylation domain-containing protein